ncbi:hypothetical protein ACKU5B_027735 [Klebsiella pneumoniae]
MPEFVVKAVLKKPIYLYTAFAGETIVLTDEQPHGTAADSRPQAQGLPAVAQQPGGSRYLIKPKR